MYERLEMLLKEKGISAYQLAKDTGISRVTLTNWKKGNYTPKIEKISIIAEYFNVSVEWLTGKSDFRNEFKNSQLKRLEAYYYKYLSQIKNENVRKLLDTISNNTDEDIAKLNDIAKVIQRDNNKK